MGVISGLVQLLAAVYMKDQRHDMVWQFFCHLSQLLPSVTGQTSHGKGTHIFHARYQITQLLPCAPVERV